MQRTLDPEMEIVEEPEPEPEVEPAPPPMKAEPVLRGMFVHEGAPQCAIDGEVYMIGDKVGDYFVKEINIDAIILQHRKTKELLELEFEEPEMVPWF